MIAPIDVCWHNDNYDGWNLLHGACEANALAFVIEVLVNTAPEALEERTESYGMLPLHHACYANAPLEIIKFLVNKWPDIIEEKDSSYEGNYPAHYACWANAPLDVVKFLYQYGWPEEGYLNWCHNIIMLYCLQKNDPELKQLHLAT